MNTPIDLHIGRLAGLAFIVIVSAVLYIARSPEPANVKISWIYRLSFLAALTALLMSVP